MSAGGVASFHLITLDFFYFTNRFITKQRQALFDFKISFRVSKPCFAMLLLTESNRR